MIVPKLLGVVFVIVQLLCRMVTADYPCVCNYNVEQTVHSNPSLDSQAIGYMYEFDCKALYNGLSKTNMFKPIQFEHKIGYMEPNSNIQVQVCPGAIPANDRVSVSTNAPQHQTTSAMVTFSSTRLSSPTNITIRNNFTTASSVRSLTSSIPMSTVAVLTKGETTSVITNRTSLAATTTPSLAVNLTTSGTSTVMRSTVSIPTSVPKSITTSLSTNATTNVPKSTIHQIHRSTSMPVCPNNWKMYGSSCYLFKTHRRKTWQDAKTDCQTMHAHLVFIETADEDKFIRDQSSQKVDTHHHHDSDTGVWLGGSDHNHEGKWEWTDTAAGLHKLVHGYTNWYKNEPDSGDGDHDEDCMCLIGDKGFLWQDARCSKHMFYVCERAVQEIHPTTTTIHTEKPITQTNLGNCPHGWTFHDDSCYFFNTSGRSTWWRADTFCSSHQAHLAIIETAAEDRFIVQEAALRVDLNVKHEIETGLWIAGTDDDVEGRWEWKDGYSYRPIHGFTHWYPGEPDSGAHDHDEDCMCLIGKREYKWQDFKCDTHMFFICEKAVASSISLIG